MMRDNLPRFFSIEQTFSSRRIDDLDEAVSQALDRCDAFRAIAPGKSVAIAVGSRGIDRIAEVARAVVAKVKDQQAEPFLVPAMGSHGGATAEGQRGVLAGAGISETQVGCPIHATMETVTLGESEHGIPIRFDAIASRADHIIPINRVKPHTRLTGSIQSGVCKMLMIGLGNHQGAEAFHQAFKQMDYRLDRVTGDFIPKITRAVPVLCGLALIEDAFDAIGHVQAIPADQLLNTEPELLTKAMQWMPSLPFKTADFLIVDEIGKEISGTGMDTNLIGRKGNDRIAEPDEWPKIDQIYVRSLTQRTEGNGTGIGIADYTHRAVVDSMDFPKTRVNCVTSGHPSAGALPIYFDCDREVLQAARSQSALPEEQLRWMWIGNTLKVAKLRCSEAYLAEAAENPSVKILDEPRPLSFDAEGNLAS